MRSSPAHAPILKNAIAAIAGARSRLSTSRKSVIVGASCAILLVALAGGAIAAAAPPEKLLPKPHGDSRVQQALASARTHPRPKTARVALAAPPSPPARRAGIVEMRQGPFPATDFTVRNLWRGPVGTSWLLVYAGTERGRSGAADRAAVRVFTETPDLHMTLIGTFPMRNGARALRVAGARGNVVELQTERGSKVSFDLLTHQFK
jgi:hypothetical protein